MSCIHYKFFSKLSYDTITFRGSHISLGDLKRQIMSREKLKATNCDLQISDAQSQEEYTDDNHLIPKNSSVIVRRIPVRGVKATGKTSVTSPTEPVSRTSEAIDGSSAPVSLAQLIKLNEQWIASSKNLELENLLKTADLTKVSASEEDKIKAMMLQSCLQYDPINYMKKPPKSCTCFRCGQLGHHARNCPTNGDRNFEPVRRIKKSTGIPQSFLMEVKDPSTKGAMVTKTGTYVVPVIDAEAYAKGKKEKPPFLPEEPTSCSSEDPVPEELLCPICKEIMTDAAVIPCCGNSYCDECIRTTLLESEEHTCPMCHQTDVSPDALVANKFLRRAVDNFKNGTGYKTSRSLEKKVSQVPGQNQPALPSLLGPQGQSIPTTDHSMRAGAIYSASGRWSCELSKSPCSAPSSSGSLHTHCKSRPDSSCTHSGSQLFRHTHSHSSSQSRPYGRRDKEQRRNRRSGSRSRACCRSRSRSTSHRRPHSRSRSLLVRGQSPTKGAAPHTEGERESFNRYAEVPRYGMKASCVSSIDFRGPFEKERYGKCERKHRERYERFYKRSARSPVNRENFSRDRFGPPRIRRENSPYAQRHKEDYFGEQSHRNRNRTGNYPEKLSGGESRDIENVTESKKEVASSLGDGKGNKHKPHLKRREEDENEGFLSAELLEGVRKPREPVTAEPVKIDSLLMLPSRDDATTMRDEPMESDFIASRPVSEKEKKEKDKPDKTKRKIEVVVPPKKDSIIKRPKASQEKVDTAHKKISSDRTSCEKSEGEVAKLN